MHMMYWAIMQTRRRRREGDGGSVGTYQLSTSVADDSNNGGLVLEVVVELMKVRGYLDALLASEVLLQAAEMVRDCGFCHVLDVLDEEERLEGRDDGPD